MKILVNCYACSPYQGSEPGMGWNFVKCLSRMHELHIITESKFQPDLDRYFTEHPNEKPFFSFYYIRKSRHKRLRKIWPPSYYWFYNAWQRKAYRLALALEKKENFDIIHQLNMVGYREPGYLWKINKPVVWGPIGGMGITPWCMLPSMGFKGMLFYASRNLINMWQMRFDCRVKNAMMKSSSLIAATSEQRDYIKALYNKESIVIPEVGLYGESSFSIAQRKEGEKFRICWSGLHIPRKSLNLLIESIACLNRDDIELHVIGGGPLTNKWKSKASCLGLKSIIWYGWKNHSDAMDILKTCHVFCITSLWDLTSTVLLESLSLGLPVIALDHCGFGNVITDECGIKIGIKCKKQVVRDISKAIEMLAGNELLRRRLSEGAIKRAQFYNWEDKARLLNNIYEQCVR